MLLYYISRLPLERRDIFFTANNILTIIIIQSIIFKNFVKQVISCCNSVKIRI